MPRVAKPKIDPLVAALIARIPPAGSLWGVEARRTWRALSEAVFDEVYGRGDPASEMPPRMEFQAVKTTMTFYIDKKGFVHRSGGKRVMPDEVKGEVVDLRGEAGDMRAIVWADDSTGLQGQDLVITAA